MKARRAVAKDDASRAVSQTVLMATTVPDPSAHAGDVVGHLPLQIAAWLAPWMFAGGRCGAWVEKVGSDDVESWRRLVVRVECHT